MTRYLRALAAFYIRLTFNTLDVYTILEPLLADYRKLKKRSIAGIELTFVDEFIDELLTEERVCGIALPQLRSRYALEETEEIEPRESALKSEIDSDSEVDSQIDSEGEAQGESTMK